MSGPPPCTTTGFMPTYLRSTTSRAKSSFSSGSVIAAPPYLITTVRPWNSRMYGRASRSVAMSRMSARVGRVEVDVLLGQVAEEDLRLPALSGQREHQLHLVVV